MAADPMTDANVGDQLPSRWDQAGLGAAGFTGFVPSTKLAHVAVPAEPGTYVVLRVTDGDPIFRATNPAGNFKRRDPTVPVDKLREAWVHGATVLYIGKAGAGTARARGLSARLNEYRRFGDGEPVGHWGGRYVFQLADADELLLAWRTTGDADPDVVKAELIATFREVHGQLPFGNRNAGRRGKGDRANAD